MIPVLTVFELDADALPAANRLYRSLDFPPSDPVCARTFAMRDARGIVALGRLLRHPDGALELGGIWTAERWRGRGLARRMVTALLRRAEAGAAIHCVAVDEVAALYAGFGFAAPSHAVPESIVAKVAAAQRVHPATLLVRPGSPRRRESVRAAAH